jgi:hypothetical protein
LSLAISASSSALSFALLRIEDIRVVLVDVRVFGVEALALGVVFGWSFWSFEFCSAIRMFSWAVLASQASACALTMSQ